MVAALSGRMENYMKMIGIAIIYVAWFVFVFAMCYVFSPWFAFLLVVTPDVKQPNESRAKPTNSNHSGDFEWKE